MREELHGDQGGAGAALFGPGKHELRVRLHDLIDAGMHVIPFPALDDDAVVSADAHIQNRFRGGRVAGAHPLPDSFRIDPGLVDDLARGRNSPANRDAMDGLTWLWHAPPLLSCELSFLASFHFSRNVLFQSI